MAGNGINGVRDNDLYVGWFKSANWGDFTQATKFWKVANGGQGFKFAPKNTLARSFEGDANIFTNLAVKESQMVDISIPERMQPITMGCALQSLFGTSSDTYTAPTFSTTIAATLTAGATTVKSTADLGNVGTLAVMVDPGLTSTTQEVLVLDLTTRTTPNYTYTIAASGTAQATHTNGATLISKATHSLVPKATTYDPYTLELGVGYTNQSSGVSRVLRARDAVAHKWQMSSGPGGRAASITHDWYAAGLKKLSSYATPTFEQGNVAGAVSGSPMTHNQATWTLNSVTTGTAAVIKSFQLSMARNTAADDFLTESTTPAYFLPGGQFTISGQFQVPLASWLAFDEAYFNSAAVADNGTDSYVVGYMPLSVVYAPDSFNGVTFTLPNVFVAAVPTVSFWAGQGKALTMAVQFETSFRTGVDASPITIAITNSQTSAY